jgi:hypothetical protein
LASNSNRCWGSEGKSKIDVGSILLNAVATNKTTFAFLFLIVVISTILKALAPRIKGWFGKRLVKSILDNFGAEHLHDVYLPTKDGATQVDHIAYVNGVILVIETKNYAGWIFGTTNQAQWTQSLAGASGDGRVVRGRRVPRPHRPGSGQFRDDQAHGAEPVAPVDRQGLNRHDATRRVVGRRLSGTTC